ncbi:MAG: ribosome biogenesis GTPase Der [bacterium]
MKEFTVAIIGAPNVGKSTLFNRLTGKRSILETSAPGTTRDRHFGKLISNNVTINIIDAGGWNTSENNSIEFQIQNQTEQAFKDADIILALFDGKAGVTPVDIELAQILRQSKKNVVYTVNKLDNQNLEANMYEFYQLGIEKMIPISSLHNRNINNLITVLKKSCPKDLLRNLSPELPNIKLCIVGRPNSGKSTLINTLCGENRVIVNPEPGTTRDSTSTWLQIDSRTVELIDTPGLRRKKKAKNPMEGLMQISSQKAIEQSDIACLLLDGTQGLTSGDVRIAGIINESKKAAIVLLNKWDIVEDPEQIQKKIISQLTLKIPFLRWAPVITISAKTSLRVSKIYPLISRIHTNFTRLLDEPKLTKAISEAFQKHRILWNRRQLIFQSVKQAGYAPPTLELEVNFPDMLHFSHKRYLENFLRDRFPLLGTPLLIHTNMKKGEKKDIVYKNKFL